MKTEPYNNVLYKISDQKAKERTYIQFLYGSLYSFELFKTTKKPISEVNPLRKRQNNLYSSK